VFTALITNISGLVGSEHQNVAVGENNNALTLQLTNSFRISAEEVNKFPTIRIASTEENIGTTDSTLILNTELSGGLGPVDFDSSIKSLIRRYGNWQPLELSSTVRSDCAHELLVVIPVLESSALNDQKNTDSSTRVVSRHVYGVMPLLPVSQHSSTRIILSESQSEGVDQGCSLAEKASIAAGTRMDKVASLADGCCCALAACKYLRYFG
jgi:hypothetical protein